MRKNNSLHIDVQKIIDNYHLILEHYLSDFPLYAVVKSNAYGHGMSRVATALYGEGQRHFSVFHLQEAVTLRKLYSDVEIMIMSDVSTRDLKFVVENSIGIVVFSLEKWEKWLEAGLKNRHIHVKLEVGMNRMGIKDVFGEKFKELADSSYAAGCDLSFYSHVSAQPDGEHKAHVLSQYRKFDEFIDYIKTEVPDYRYLHLYKSSNLPYVNGTYYGARPGILLYGYSSLPDHSQFPWLDKLQPAMEVKSFIMQIETVKKGEYIGYGLNFRCPEDKLIGYVPIGYADGLPYALSNKGKVLTEHGFCPIIGTVNMNIIAIDLTDKPDAHIEDEVIILGSNSRGTITARDHAETAGTILYEILTSLGER